VKKLTQRQTTWLKRLTRGENPYALLASRSEYGGATKVRASLFVRGLIDGSGRITDAGRAAVAPLMEVER
jgi:hypothetical protein